MTHTIEGVNMTDAIKGKLKAAWRVGSKAFLAGAIGAIVAQHQAGTLTADWKSVGWTALSGGCTAIASLVAAYLYPNYQAFGLGARRPREGLAE